MKSLVAIVGTTGVGKSSLAIKIAQRLAGQIVNADSIQVYKNLDIISNKPTKEEFNTVAHHLFDFVDNTREYSVAEFTSDATKVIDSLHEKSILPVVVGGTNYYVQSLLFESQIISTSESPGISNKTLIAHSSIDPEIGEKLSFVLRGTDPAVNSFEQIESFVSENNMHELLKIVDPDMANRWHPNDVRKIRRSLEVYYTTGRKHSEHYGVKEELMRYRTCVFWLYSPPDILDPALEARIDVMIQRGMFDEMKVLLEMMAEGEVVGCNSSYTRGILQAIGFKEFQDYFRLVNENASNKEIIKAKEIGIENMKIATRQYARKQVHWLKNKLGPMLLQGHHNGKGAIYLIDASDPSKLNNLIDQAVHLVQNFIEGKPNLSVGHLDASDFSQELLNHSRLEHKWEHYECEFCVDRKSDSKKLIHGKRQWDLHLQSSSHRRRVKARQEMESNRYWIEKKVCK